MRKTLSKIIFSVSVLLLLFNMYSFCDMLDTTSDMDSNYGWRLENNNWRYLDKDGNYLTDTIKKSNNNTYYLDEDGNMVTDYLLVDDDKTYYFDDMGIMVTNAWLTLDPSNFEDKWDASAYFMYFQENGKAVRGKDGEGKRKTIEGKTYFFDGDGIMLTGWITEEGEHLDSDNSDDWYSEDAVYYAYEDGSLAEGWLKWADSTREGDNEIVNAAGDLLDLEVMYFYFNPSNNKKVEGQEKTINGRKYRFLDENGRMMTRWEYLESKGEFNVASDSDNKYYGGDYDGSLYKNQWVYDVPSSLISEEKYEDEEKEWFFAGGNGKLCVDQEKKINNKIYLFDKDGVMQHNLIVKCYPKDTESKYYILRVDMECADPDEFVKEGILRLKDKPVPYDSDIQALIDDEDELLIKSCINITYGVPDSDIKPITWERLVRPLYKVFYFGEDGAKRVGNNIKINFGGKEYIFASKQDGGYHGFHGGKYYQNGFLCKANPDIGYGILVDYTAFDLSHDVKIIQSLGNNKTRIETYLRNLKPHWYNYNYFLIEMAESSGLDKEVILNAVKNASLFTKGYITGESANLTEYHTCYPRLGLMAKFSNALPLMGGVSYKSVAIFAVDKNGKKKSKGSYKDKNGNYWLVDKNQEFVGVFTVPVKWGKVDGEEVPMYKSTFYETNNKGEQIEKEKYMSFFTKDMYGSTELDYVFDIDNDYLVNAKIGDFNFNEDI